MQGLSVLRPDFVWPCLAAKVENVGVWQLACHDGGSVFVHGVVDSLHERTGSNHCLALGLLGFCPGIGAASVDKVLPYALYCKVADGGKDGLRVDGLVVHLPYQVLEIAFV